MPRTDAGTGASEPAGATSAVTALGLRPVAAVTRRLAGIRPIFFRYAWHVGPLAVGLCLGWKPALEREAAVRAEEAADA